MAPRACPPWLRLFLAAVVAAAALAGCSGPQGPEGPLGGGGAKGGGGPGAPPVGEAPDAGSQGPAVGGGAPDAGAAAGAGAVGGADTGSSSSPGAGSASSSGTASGSSSGSSGSSSGSASGSGSGSASGSGSSASAGAPDPCDGLLPTVGQPTELDLETGSHAVCWSATSNPQGQLALGVRGSIDSTVGTAYFLYTSDGHPLASQSTLGVVQGFAQSVDIDPEFHWTDGGYVGIVHDPATGAVQTPLRVWDASGAFVRDVAPIATATAPDGHGGSVALAVTFDAATSTSGPPLLLWVTPAGDVTRAVTLDRAPSVVLVDWNTGHVVVATKGGAAQARWFDGSGAPLTPWFAVGKAVSGTSMHLLTDGTVVLNDGGAWDVALRDGVASADAVPAWLAARPGTRLATIRGGRGFAVLPFPADGGAAQGQLEIVTSDGKSCGTVKLPAAHPPAGQTQVPQRLDVGQDGTLFQSAVIQQDGAAFVHCAFRWRPALLR